MPLPNIPTALMPTVPAIDVNNTGLRLMARRTKALNHPDSGHGNSRAERNQEGIPPFEGTGLDCTERISWWISRYVLWLAPRMT